MTEISLPWDGTSTGDAGTYTSDEWRQFIRGMSRGGSGTLGLANVGVIGAFLNSLVPSSPGDDQISAATGAAIVDGTLYENDAVVTKTMSTPSVGTTGKRLVLQKDWTAQTVRLAVISSADGTASLPSLTQSDGVTWEAPVCSFTHGTDGTIAAVTDERVFTNPNSFEVIFDGGGTTVATGVYGDIVVPRDFHLTGWQLLADQSGSIACDVWVDTYANFPPDNSDTYTGGDDPTISTATKAQNLNIGPEGNWTLDLSLYDIIRVNVDSATSIQRATLTLFGAG